jgi:hypothetical protein
MRLTKLSGEGLPTGYWVEGVLINDIEVGKPIDIFRVANSLNEQGKLGLFTSSPVVSIDGPIIKTQNSIWSL